MQTESDRKVEKIKNINIQNDEKQEISEQKIEGKIEDNKLSKNNAEEYKLGSIFDDKNLFKRIITGIIYIGIFVGFFFLRAIHASLFLILIYAFSLVGTKEMVNAFGNSLAKSQRIAVFVYALVFTPAYFAIFWLCGGLDIEKTAYASSQGFRVMLITSFMLCVALLVLLVVDKKATLTGMGNALICGVYPTAILGTMIMANDMGFERGSTLALILIFAIAPACDTFAYVCGSIFKGPKMCPKISPKKTWSGAIGGVVFGTAITLAIFGLFQLTSDHFMYAGLFQNPWITFTIIGILCSIMTIFGDLVESVIKRQLGIKDMGKILPGHGGILDRIDGMLFASMFIYIVFVLFVA